MGFLSFFFFVCDLLVVTGVGWDFDFGGIVGCFVEVNHAHSSVVSFFPAWFSVGAGCCACGSLWNICLDDGVDFAEFAAVGYLLGALYTFGRSSVALTGSGLGLFCVDSECLDQSGSGETGVDPLIDVMVDVASVLGVDHLYDLREFFVGHSSGRHC